MGRHERMTPSAPHTGPHTSSHSVSGAPQRGRLLTLLVALVAIIGLPVGNALLSPAVPVNTSLARPPLTNGLPVPKAPKISLPSVKDKIRSGNRLSTPELSRGRIYISSAQWRRKLQSRISELETAVVTAQQQLRTITNQSQRDANLLTLRQNLSQLAQLREERSLLGEPASGHQNKASR